MAHKVAIASLNHFYSLKMLALSIRQPWANLILEGIKDVENRNWSTKCRGRILIHAAKTCTEIDLIAANQCTQKYAKGRIITSLDAGPRGGIVGTVEIVRCVVSSKSPWFFGPYGFVLRDPKPLPFIPWRGQLGFFDVPKDELPLNLLLD